MAPALSDESAVGLEALSVFLATVFVLLRGYVQIYLRAIFSLSDCFICLSYTIFVLIFVGDMFCYSAGQWEFDFGSPNSIQNALQSVQSERKLRMIYKILYVSGPLYFVSLWCIKAAFLLFYFVLIPRCFPYLRLFLQSTAVLTFGTAIISFCFLMFSCLPVSRNWALDGTICASFNAPYAYWFSVSAHTFTDLCIYSMPFFLLFDLQLSRVRTLGVAGMFALGFISIAINITRVVLVAFTNFQQAYVNSLSAIEMATAIMVACSPPLKSMLKGTGRGSVKETTEWGTIRFGMAQEDDIEGEPRMRGSSRSSSRFLSHGHGEDGTQRRRESSRGSSRVFSRGRSDDVDEMVVTVRIDAGELQKAGAESWKA